MAVNHTEAMPPQLRAARVRKQRVIKAIILTFTLLFLFVPLVSMFVFTIRHPLSGKWSLDPWIAIFTGDGSALGADLSTLWSGLGSSMGLCVVTVVIMLLLMVPTMVIVHIRSKQLERAIEWVATLPLTIPAIVLVVGLGPIYRWLSADVLSTNPIWLCFAYVILVMPFAWTHEPAGGALPAWPIQLPNLHRHVAAGTTVRRDPAGSPRSYFRRTA